MATYYCPDCMIRYGLISPEDPTGLTANQYQLDKFIKHTTPTGIYPVNSVFRQSDWNTYQNFMVTTAVSGCLEVDDGGRKNLIFFAGKETGLRYDSGSFTAPCSGVKLVLSEDASRVHAFPSDFAPESKTCANCGKPVPYDPR